MTTFYGWANYHTWNVSLYMSNEEPLYFLARMYARKHKESATYRGFIGDELPQTWGDVTPDGVSWTDPTLDHDELDAFIRELAE